MYIKQYISKDVDTKYLTSAYKSSTPKGDLQGLISVVGDGSFAVDRVSKFVWDGVIDAIAYSEDESTIESLKKALSEGKKRLVGLIKNDPELEEKGVNLSFALSILKDGVTYIAVFGEQEIFLYKDGKFVDISKMLTANNVDTGSLKLEDTDVLVLGSPRLLNSFVSTFNDSESKSVNILGDIESFADNLSGNQGMLLIADESMVVAPVEEVKEEEVLGDKPQVPEEFVVDEGVSPVVEPEEKELEVFKGDKEPPSKYLEVLKNIGSSIWNVLLRIGEFFQNLFSKMGEGFKKLVDDKYGRTLWYKRIASKLSLMRLGKNSSAKGMKIDGYADKTTKNKRFVIVTVVGIILITFFLGIQYTIKAKELREVHEAAVVIMDKAKEYIESANTLVQSDKVQAETNLFNANIELVKLEEYVLNEEDLAESVNIEISIVEVEDKLYKRTILNVDAGNFESVLDTRISFGENSNPTDIAFLRDTFLNEHLYITDAGVSKVYKMTIYDENISRLPDSNSILKSPTYIDVGADGIYVYDSEVGVLQSKFDERQDNGDFTALSGLGIDDLDGTNYGEMAIFTASDNVYLMDRDKSSIIKSPRTDSGSYGLAYTYISDASLNNGEDIFGDFSIYLLSDSKLGRFVYDYSVGAIAENGVSLTGLSPSDYKFIAGYTGGTLDKRLYVFDELHKRILNFEKPKESAGDMLHPKEMVLMKQYLYRGDLEGVFDNVKDIVVDGAEEYMFVLDGQQVWQIKL